MKKSDKACLAKTLTMLLSRLAEKHLTNMVEVQYLDYGSEMSPVVDMTPWREKSLKLTKLWWRIKVNFTVVNVSTLKEITKITTL